MTILFALHSKNDDCQGHFNSSGISSPSETSRDIGWPFSPLLLRPTTFSLTTLDFSLVLERLPHLTLLLTTLGSAPSLSITWVSCVAPTLKLETAEATAPSTLRFLRKQSWGISTRSLNASIHSHSVSSLWPVFFSQKIGISHPRYTGTSCSATSCFSGHWISWAWGAGSSFLAMALLKKHQESCPVGQRL